MNDPYLTTEAAAAYLSMHPKTVQRKAKKGIIPFAGRVGSEYRFRRADLDNWLQGKGGPERAQVSKS